MRLLAALLLTLTFAISAAEPLTNDTVIRMVQARVPADVIVKTIAAADAVQFSMLPLDLAALGRAGVTDDVIKAMAAKVKNPISATPVVEVRSRTQEKKVKDQGEFDLYQNVVKETDQDRKLRYLNQWVAKYPDSDYYEEQLRLYGDLNQPAKVMELAPKVLVRSPKSFVALYLVTDSIRKLANPSQDQIAFARESAQTLLDNLDVLKPANVPNDKWQQNRSTVENAAKNALMYIAAQDQHRHMANASEQPNGSAKNELPPPPDISHVTIGTDQLAKLETPSNGAGSGKGGGFGPGEGGGVSNGVYKVGGGVTAPSIIYKVEAEYSEEARKAGYRGTVVLYIEVDPMGRAMNPRVVRSLGLGLDEKAIEAVKQWKFKPGYKDGQPVTVSATIEFNFQNPGPGGYPLRVYIVQTQWTNTPYGTSGWGRGNIRDGQSYYGFDFTYTCTAPFRATIGGSLYPGKWKKENLRLTILTGEIGEVKRTHECELKTSARKEVYDIRAGQLVTYSPPSAKAYE